MDRQENYGAVAKFFHWLIFLLLALQFAVGWLMPHIGRDTPNEGLVNWHLSLGAAILAVIVLRFLWRLRNPVPAPSTLTSWERKLALVTHWSLYLLVFGMTMLGWAAANFRGWTVMLFGVLPLPALAPKGTAWAHTAGDVHITLVYVLLGVIGLHVAGALFHFFIRKDRVMQRMLMGDP